MSSSIHSRKSNVSNDTSYVEHKDVTDPYGGKGVYTGELSNSTCMPNGSGRMDYEKEGRWYDGDWIHGRWTGRGSLANGDGDFYEGGMKNGEKHGEGTMKFADGRIFDGEYARGQMIQGKMKYQDRSIYFGAWENGMRHGKGRIDFVDGSSYDGEFREGDFGGHGKMVWPDGGWYLGEWKDGKINGRGKEIRADGSLRHDDEWHQGQPSTGALADSKRAQVVERVDATQTESSAPVRNAKVSNFKPQPLPKCFCNWIHCRTYQKAFREYNHPFFNGAIKLKFSQTDSRSMALKSAVDRILCIDSACHNDWKEGDNGEPFCRYYVARHHFTEALINEYLQDRRAWDWNRPLSMEDAKKFLWSLDQDDVYHSEDEAEDDRYIQAPNVPKDKVRRMLKEWKDQHKKAQEQETMGEAVLMAMLMAMPANELTLLSSVTDAPEVLEESEVQSGLDTSDTLLAEKEEENRRLRDEIQDAQQQLHLLQGMVPKLVDMGLPSKSQRPSSGQDKSLQQPDDDDTITSLHGNGGDGQIHPSYSINSRKSVRDEESYEQDDRNVQVSIVPKDRRPEFLEEFKHQNKEQLVAEEKTAVETVANTVESTLPDCVTDTLKDFEESEVRSEPDTNNALLAEQEEENGRLRAEIQDLQQHINSQRDVVLKLVVDISHMESTSRRPSSEQDKSSQEQGRNQQSDDDTISTLHASGGDGQIQPSFSIHSRTSSVRDDISTRSNRSASERSYHSTTSSHRSRAKPQEVDVDKDVWSDENYNNDDLSTASCRSENSTKPTSLVVPGEIELVNGAEEEADGISLGEDDKSATSIGSQSEGSKASRGSLRRFHDRNADPFRSKRRDSDNWRDFYEERLKDDEEEELKDATYSNVSNDTSYVKEKQIVDPFGEKGVYTGELSKATTMPNGRGRLDYEKEGCWYDGEWLHGRWTGRGSLANGNGDFYEGSWKNGKKHGEGVMKFADGRKFEGEYIRNQMIHGKMTYQDGGTYTGSWVDYMRHGKGRIDFADGSSYDGEVREGAFHGPGKMVWADGGWYVGEWRQGTMHGHGKEMTPDGRVRHDGEWRQGQPSIGALACSERDHATRAESRDAEKANSTMNSVQFDSDEQAKRARQFPRPSADRFFSTLRDYLSCRKTMEAAFLKDGDMSAISMIEAWTDSGGIEEHGGESHQFKPEFQQQSISGKAVKSLDELYEAAKIAMPIFQKLVNNLVSKVSKTSKDDPQSGNQESPMVVIGTKGRDRAQEKAVDDYSSREPGPEVSWLYDIVRGSIKFQSSQQIHTCIMLLLESDEYFVVKAKNRFKNPTLTGYRDFAIWIQIECKGFSHVCEIQIHHAGMKKLDSELGSHLLYEHFRWYFSGAVDSLSGCLQDLEMISEGYQLEGLSMETFIKDCTEEDRLERLASLFHEQMCEFDLALAIYEKLLQMRQLRYDENHIAIAKTYDSQAAVYRDKGQLERAMQLYEKCLPLYKGTSKMSLAATYQHMAVIKTESGFAKTGLLLYQRSLDILSALPPETVNMSLADICNNMGNAKRDLGFLDDAIALHQKSLDIKKEYLGEEHSSVATSLNNLGLVRLKQGMVDKAVDLFLEALKVDQRVVGAEHSSIAVTQGNLGLSYEQKGDFAAAREMYGQALKQQRSILGNQHEEVAGTLDNLGRIHVKEQDFDRAIELFQESLEIKTTAFDPNHAEVAATKKMLDSALRKKSRGKTDIEVVENDQIT